MRFLPPEENVVLYQEGFSEDVLGRKKVGQSLSDLLERIEDPLVVVLDGAWGAGKSYFLKRWVGAHSLQFGGSGTTIYFDAFANDYLDDPLIALISTLSERIPPEKQPAMRKVKSLALKMLRPAARVGLSVATFGATAALEELGDAVVTAASDEAKEAVDTFWKREDGRRAAMAQFHDAVSTLMKNSTDGDEAKNSIIIVIDELDRCRPDYALQVLEVIKHFFSLPRLHFVLGVNLSALENSVKTRYGAGINATMYLQKFISVTFTLPDTVDLHKQDLAVVAYARDVSKKMGLPSRITNPLIDHLKLVSRVNFVSMRDISRIMAQLSLLPRHVLDKDYLAGWIEVMLTLVVSKEVRPDLYKAFKSATVSRDELISYFGAKPDVVSPQNNGKPNPRYDHGVYWRFQSWLYLSQDGKIDDESDTRGISTLFFSFPRGDVGRIPGQIYDDWLDLFSIR